MLADPTSDEWLATERFTLMLQEATRALRIADPVRLMPDAPSDEYELEAAQIVRLVLREVGSRDDVLRIAGGVFAECFGGNRY